MTVTYRALGEGELHRYHEYGDEPRSGVGVRSRPFDEEGYRPDWVWIAESGASGASGASSAGGGRTIARAALWGPDGATYPWTVDRFDPGTGPDRVEVGAELLRRAYAALANPDGSRPDYHLLLPADWRERDDARADAEDRIHAAEAAGLTHFVERVNVVWTPADGLPPRPGRLRFTPAAADPDATRRALAGICTD